MSVRVNQHPRAGAEHAASGCWGWTTTRLARSLRRETDRAGPSAPASRPPRGRARSDRNQLADRDAAIGRLRRDSQTPASAARRDVCGDKQISWLVSGAGGWRLVHPVAVVVVIIISTLNSVIIPLDWSAGRSSPRRLGRHDADLRRLTVGVAGAGGRRMPWSGRRRPLGRRRHRQAGHDDNQDTRLAAAVGCNVSAHAAGSGAGWPV